MFISYSQNFEDVILNRLFPDKSSGFYIDIGAHHPILDSVTKAFYDRGWCGINIEPVKKYFELLEQARERDINLNIAIGETESELEFFELDSAGLSTFDRETAYRLAETENFTVHSSYKVPLRKLGDICREQVKLPIDFLKIDVEGWEEKVILGHDWENFRPIVVVLEATIPNSPIRAETNIKSILENNNYFHVYFDGLNDYFLAREREDLRDCFAIPPNVFDKFISYSVVTLQNHANNLQKVVQERELEINSFTEALKSKEAEVNSFTEALKSKEAEINSFTEALKSKEAEINSFTETLKSKEAEINSLTETLKSKEIDLRNCDRLNHILQNRLQDEQFEIQRLTKILAQLEKKIESFDLTPYHNQIADLQFQLSQANQTVIAMRSSKFWKIRQVWFRLKKAGQNNLGH